MVALAQLGSKLRDRHTLGIDINHLVGGNSERSVWNVWRGWYGELPGGEYSSWGIEGRGNRLLRT